MVEAVIMVEAGTGASGELVPDVAALDDVEEAHVVAGDYDVVVEASGETPSDVVGDVASRILSVDGVEDTRTYVALE